jgi:hypothetical protein
VYEKKNRENDIAYTKPYHRVSDLVSESEKAIREGNSQYAYELSLKATQTAPENIEAWLLRATLAPSLEERVICVNRLNELSPDHQDRYNVAFFALKELLDQNPFLAYLEETEDLYRVINADHMVLSIPKKRVAVNTSSPEQSGKLKTAYRCLVMAMLGLMLAGLGTLIFAPLAALAAIQAGQSSQSRSDWVSSTIVLILAALLFMIGSIFSFLFVLHWMG